MELDKSGALSAELPLAASFEMQHSSRPPEDVEAVPLLEQEDKEAPVWPERNQLPSPRSRWRYPLLACCALGVLSAGFWLGRPLLSTATEQSCTPEAFDAGHWVQVRDPHKVYSSEAEVFAASNYTVCQARTAGDYWHGALREGDGTPWWLTEPVGRQHAYAWQPGQGCQLRSMSMLERLQLLVDKPLLLAGDSRMRQQLLQLSCEFGEHTIWSIEKPLDNKYPDTKGRYLLQHLHLDPNSPLLGQLRGEVDLQRPIISYVPLFLPMTRDELVELPGVDAALVYQLMDATDEAPPMFQTLSWTLSYFERYQVMLLNIGSHVSTLNSTIDLQEQAGLTHILQVGFEALLAALQQNKRSDQRVLVRAIVAGHGDCPEAFAPLEEEQPPVNTAFLAYSLWPAWSEILRHETVALGAEWLGLRRLSALRPDAHLAAIDPARWSDCTHVLLGSGLYEAYTQYMWHRMAEL